MANINLLPWREELRVRRQKEYIVTIVVAVVAMLGVIGAIHWQLEQRIDFQKSRNRYLTTQIAIVNKKIKQIKTLEQEKENLLARMGIVERLQSSRPEIVHLFEELVRTLPEGIYFTEIKQKGRDIEVKGVAQSNARVSSLMRHIEKSEWLEKPDLVEIRKLSRGQGKEIKFSEFSLRFQQKHSKSGQGDDQETSS